MNCTRLRIIEHFVVVYLRECLLDGIHFINYNNISDLQKDEKDLLVLGELTDDEEILAYCELCSEVDALDHLRLKRLNIDDTLSNDEFIPLQQGGPVLAEDAAAAAGQACGLKRPYLHRYGGTVHTANEVGLSKQTDRSSANVWPPSYPSVGDV